MIYIKSTLVGIVMLFLATIAYAIVMMIILPQTIPAPPNAEVSFDLTSIFKNWSYWLIAITAFALGFYWKARRAEMQNETQFAGRKRR